MLPEWGHFALILAWMLAILSVFSRGSLQQHKGLLLLQGLCIQLSVFSLLYAFLNNDFSLQYVAQHAYSALTWYYKIGALWGAHEGSVLLWIWVLNLWSLFFILTASKSVDERVLRDTARLLSGLQVVFLLFLLQLSNPFMRLFPIPIDGQDLNPLLQDMALMIHPPILYLGLIGFAVPFCFAIAYLLNGTSTFASLRCIKQSVSLAFGFLSLGIGLGSLWAYYELGWGGYWFWDPVENVSLMPWLTGLALLHTLPQAIQSGRWLGLVLSLCLSTFLLALLGTFLIRSGVLSSVHSFALDPGRGLYMLAFWACAVVLAVGILVFRWPSASSSPMIQTRKTFYLLLQNGLLVILTMVVALGTLFPIVYEVLFHQKISVGFPYFNQVFIPLSFPALLLLGFWSWKQNRVATWMLCMSLLFAFMIAWYYPAPVFQWSGYVTFSLGCGLGFFVCISTLQFIRPQPRWPLFLGHLGLGLLIMGISFNAYYSSEREYSLKLGDQLSLGGTQLTWRHLDTIEGDNYLGYRAHFEDKTGIRILPEKRFFTSQFIPMTETGIDSSFIRDLYLALGEPLEQGYWSLRAYYKPAMRWIWVGVLCMALGGFIAAYRRQ